MKIDFARIKQEGLFKAYPELKVPVLTNNIPDFPEQAHDKVLLYAFLAYHKDSPFREAETSVQRKKQALAECGFGKLKGVAAKVDEELVQLKSERFREIVSFVLRHGRSYKWVRLVSAEEAFFQITSRILQPIDPDATEGADKNTDSKAKLVKSQAEISETIEELRKEFFADDEELETMMHGNDLEDSDMEQGLAERMVSKYLQR